MYAIMMHSHYVVNFTFSRENIVTVKMSHVLHGNSYFRVQVFFESEIVNKYPTFRNHVKELYDNWKAVWCSAFRHDTFLRGNDTNNYVEASMRILKDMVCSCYHSINNSFKDCQSKWDECKDHSKTEVEAASLLS